MVRMALLVGIEYPNSSDVLLGCKNDVKKLKDCLISRLNFHSPDIQIMVDNGRRINIPITARQIVCNLTSMSQNATSHDTILLYLTGHGGNGFLYCTDGSRFTDEMINDCLKLVPFGCNFTVILDCCHSGSFDIGKAATVYASCRANQLSAVAYDHLTTHGGLVCGSKFTQVLLKVVKRERGKITTAKLIQKVSRMIQKREKKASRRFYYVNRQSPILRCLECHKKKKFLW